MELSNRLKTVAKYVTPGSIVADIGSDHAYLPIDLVSNRRIKYAIAGEVAQGPYQNACREVRRYGMTDIIDVRLGDGLDVITSDDAIDTITICGMGGKLITDILKRGHQLGRLQGTEQLILQPNVGEAIVRDYLEHIQYAIIEEDILEEHNQLYEIIMAKPSQTPVKYTDTQKQFGVYLPEQSSCVFKKKWLAELRHLYAILDQVELSARDRVQEKMSAITDQIDTIKEIIGYERNR